jgi:hypothetical protein
LQEVSQRAKENEVSRREKGYPSEVSPLSTENKQILVKDKGEKLNAG